MSPNKTAEQHTSSPPVAGGPSNVNRALGHSMGPAQSGKQQEMRPPNKRQRTEHGTQVPQPPTAAVPKSALVRAASPTTLGVSGPARRDSTSARGKQVAFAPLPHDYHLSSPLVQDRILPNPARTDIESLAVVDQEKFEIQKQVYQTLDDRRSRKMMESNTMTNTTSVAGGPSTISVSSDQLRKEAELDKSVNSYKAMLESPYVTDASLKKQKDFLRSIGVTFDEGLSKQADDQAREIIGLNDQLERNNEKHAQEVATLKDRLKKNKDEEKARQLKSLEGTDSETSQLAEKNSELERKVWELQQSEHRAETEKYTKLRSRYTKLSSRYRDCDKSLKTAQESLEQKERFIEQLVLSSTYIRESNEANVQEHLSAERHRHTEVMKRFKARTDQTIAKLNTKLRTAQEESTKLEADANRMISGLRAELYVLGERVTGYRDMVFRHDQRNKTLLAKIEEQSAENKKAPVVDAETWTGDHNTGTYKDAQEMTDFPIGPSQSTQTDEHTQTGLYECHSIQTDEPTQTGLYECHSIQTDEPAQTGLYKDVGVAVSLPCMGCVKHRKDIESLQREVSHLSGQLTAAGRSYDRLNRRRFLIQDELANLLVVSETSESELEASQRKVRLLELELVISRTWHSKCRIDQNEQRHQVQVSLQDARAASMRDRQRFASLSWRLVLQSILARQKEARLQARLRSYAATKFYLLVKIRFMRHQKDQLFVDLGLLGSQRRRLLWRFAGMTLQKHCLQLRLDQCLRFIVLVALQNMRFQWRSSNLSSELHRSQMTSLRLGSQRRRILWRFAGMTLQKHSLQIRLDQCLRFIVVVALQHGRLQWRSLNLSSELHQSRMTSLRLLCIVTSLKVRKARLQDLLACSKVKLLMEEHHHTHDLVRLRLTGFSDRLLFLGKLKTITSAHEADQLEVRRQLGDIGISREQLPRPSNPRAEQNSAVFRFVAPTILELKLPGPDGHKVLAVCSTSTPAGHILMGSCCQNGRTPECVSMSLCMVLDKPADVVLMILHDVNSTFTLIRQDLAVLRSSMKMIRFRWNLSIPIQGTYEYWELEPALWKRFLEWT